MTKERFSSRLKHALDMRGITQSELCRRTGINKSAICQYLKGAFEPKQDRVYLLSKVLEVSEAWLMGYDVPLSGDPSPELARYGALPITTKRLPLLGDIACGEPIFAAEDRESYMEVGTDIDADFCLRAKGDSMINARISDGDIVFIRKQPTVQNGEIAAVVIDNAATLKRVYYDREHNILHLAAENAAYPPQIYTGAELDEINILGKAVAFQSDVK